MKKDFRDSLPNALQVALSQIDKDAGCLYEPEVISLLRELSPADWQRARSYIKGHSDVKITDLDDAIKEQSANHDSSVTDKLVILVDEYCELFHDAKGEAYATFERDGHSETWPIKSTGFEDWLSWQFYQLQEMAPRKQALEDALHTLCGKAKFEGDEREVALRVARVNDKVYIDLGNDAVRYIEMSLDGGYLFLENPPVKFVRTSSMRNLPMSTQPGNLEDFDILWELLNIPKEYQVLVLAWILDAFLPHTPYCVLELVGEAGSAKSLTQDFLRNLIDPSAVNLRAEPKSREDIFVSCENSHLVSFNNVSYLSAGYQDALCCLATGGGFGARKLYTNNEEVLINVQRPVIMNGISTLATAPDLMDRTIHIEMPRIVDRRDEVDLRKRFEDEKEDIFRCIVCLLALTLGKLKDIDIPGKDLPRMADYAKLGEALCQSFDQEPGTFLTRYKAMKQRAVHRVIDSSAVAQAVVSYLTFNPHGFSGTVQSGFATLETFRSNLAEAWPRSTRGFGDALRRIAPALRQIGIIVGTSGRTRNGYGCHMQYEDVRSEPCELREPYTLEEFTQGLCTSAEFERAEWQRAREEQSRYDSGLYRPWH